jgi:hypothetical protein
VTRNRQTNGQIGTGNRAKINNTKHDILKKFYFQLRSKRLWGPTSLLYSRYQFSFSGVKRPGRGVHHPPPSSAKVKRKSTATPLLPLWAFVACSRVNFTFTFTFYCQLHAPMVTVLPYFSTVIRSHPQGSQYLRTYTANYVTFDRK